MFVRAGTVSRREILLILLPGTSQHTNQLKCLFSPSNRSQSKQTKISITIMLLKHSSLLLLCATTMIDIVRGQDNPESYFAGADNETYVEWLRDVNYTKSTFLSNPRDETKGAALHWTIDGEKIRLAVAAKAKGWSGFGTYLLQYCGDFH